MQGPDCFLQLGSEWINDCPLSLTAPAEVIHCINWILMQPIDLKANNRMNVLLTVCLCVLINRAMDL